MSVNRRDLAALLRWYPKAWRERYGAELVALIEDQLKGGPASLGLRASLAWSGLRERGHDVGLLGEGSPAKRMRAGSLLILCSWAALMLGAASFSKLSEHFAAAMPAPSRPVAQIAYDTVVSLAVTGVALVLVGGLVAVPSLARFLQQGGGRGLRRHVATATALTLACVATVVPLAAWAHHLTSFQRNGGDNLYSGAFVGWAIVVAATLAAWTTVATVAAHRIDFKRAALRCEAALALALCVVMVGIVVAIAIWWECVGANASWFLQGTPRGVAVTPVSLNIFVTMLLMVAASTSSVIGGQRIARSWRRA